jgi:glycine/D-amino acid oxidase-like deaminating enzyme/nitrite reductase/ring-hydroxylating ferredoxin subunit
VIVLEKDGPGEGQTGRTTAHLSNVMDDRFTELERAHGVEGSRLAAESHGFAIDAFEEIVREEGIACDFRRLDGWLFLAPGQERERLDEEEAAARRAGLVPERHPRAPLDGFDTGPCLRFPGQAQLHPLAFLAGLCRALTARGGIIHGGTRVVAVEEDDGEVVVQAESGGAVRCRDVVLATNSPAGRYLAQMKMVPYRSYVATFRVPRGRLAPALWWDMADPYHYVRLSPAGEHDLLVVGGEDHRTGTVPGDTDPHDHLEAWTRERFPSAGEVVHRWSGQVLEPADHLAFTGRAPGSEHVWFHTGDSGQGMTHGMLASSLLTDLLRGRESRWADLYTPARLSTAGAGGYLDGVVGAARRFLEYLLPGDRGSVEDVLPGEGAVLKRERHPVAVYRDPSGTLHERSAVCTHEGCVVAWNPDDPGWDCACHGSRFDPLGKVVSGPAVQDLEETEAVTHEPPARHPGGRKARAPSR